MAITQQTPEALGPGTDHPDGSVTYGDKIRPRTGPIPARGYHPADPDHPVNVVPHLAAYGCQRCHGIPDGVLGPLREAIGGQR